MEIRNLTADAREIPDVGFVEAGGVIEVDDDLGESLTEQVDVWGDADAGTTVKDVLAEVGDDPDRARQALAVERGSEKPRKSLVSRLEEIAANDEEQG